MQSVVFRKTNYHVQLQAQCELTRSRIMRPTLTAVLIVLLFARELPARSNHNWENVKKLKPGARVRVLLWSGQELSGAVDAVSAVGLRIATVGGNVHGV